MIVPLDLKKGSREAKFYCGYITSFSKKSKKKREKRVKIGKRKEDDRKVKEKVVNVGKKGHRELKEVPSFLQILF